MFSRRPGFRFNRGRVAVGPVAPGGGGGAVLQSAVIATDGYSIDLTYDATPPSDANFELTGTPEFIVGASVAGNVRTLQASGPILDTETVTIDSNTLTAQATTNSSTEAGADYTTGLLSYIDPRTGLTHTGDGTETTSITEQSGNGYVWVPTNTGEGALYDAQVPAFNNQPGLVFTARAMQSTSAGLVAAMVGQGVPWTLITMVTAMNNIAQLKYQLSYGQKNAGANRYVTATLASGTSRVRINSNVGNFTRQHNTADEWQEIPYPMMMGFRYTGNTTIEILRPNAQPLTLDSSSFVMTGVLTPDTLAINANLQATNYVLGGAWTLGAHRLYNAALTDAQMRQAGRAMTADYKVVGFGCSPARALAA